MQRDFPLDALVPGTSVETHDQPLGVPQPDPEYVAAGYVWRMPDEPMSIFMIKQPLPHDPSLQIRISTLHSINI
jgi:hypothetical protein